MRVGDRPASLFGQVSDGVLLSQKVVAQISELVARGQLQPGDRLPTEREMAAQFGVSRTAVRDAIKLLAGRGILEVKRGAGIFIASREGVADHFALLLRIRQGSIEELFEVRKLIEVQAAGWAAERGSPEAIAAIQRVVAEAEAALDDPAALARCDAAFHVAVAAAARNGVLLRIMQNLLDLLASSREESLRIPGRAARSVGEHRTVLAAIERGDAAAARQRMWEHLDSVERAIVQRFHSLEGARPPNGQGAAGR
jgi:GntR family transcriptional repressor for pyruvate dehydrogenase complex